MVQESLKKYRRSVLEVLAGGGMIVALLALAAILPTSTAYAQGSPKIIKPDSVAYGRTYSDWSAAWWQWALSIPVSIHPLFNNGDCSVGQSGPVWFLGGSFVGSSTGNTAVRDCTVPAGKALFFPVLNGEISSLEESLGDGCANPTFDATIVGVSICAVSGQDGATVSAEIDGAPVPFLAERFRVQSSAFGFTLPDDNLFKATTAHDYKAGTYFPAVGDGYYLMLSPLPAGRHVIHFHGVFKNGFTLDITYNLTVER